VEAKGWKCKRGECQQCIEWIFLNMITEGVPGSRRLGISIICPQGEEGGRGDTGMDIDVVCPGNPSKCD